MTYKAMTYKLLVAPNTTHPFNPNEFLPICIQNTVTGAVFNADPANTDYAAYLAWVTAGNMPESAPEPPAPVELTPAQKLAASGLTVEELKQLLGLE
jgi:hypothetical protein